MGPVQSAAENYERLHAKAIIDPCDENDRALREARSNLWNAIGSHANWLPLYLGPVGPHRRKVLVVESEDRILCNYVLEPADIDAAIKNHKLAKGTIA